MAPDTSFGLSSFTLHAPSATMSYWFVSHDFAEVLGMEYSENAARELKQLLKGFRVSIDFEADAVTLRIRRNDDVIPVLRSIYARADWDPIELAAIDHGWRRAAGAA